VTKDVDCANEVKSRLAIGRVTMIKLWENKSVSNSTKLRLIGALVWPVAVYGCEAWTLKKQEDKCIQAFENKCIRKIMRISWTKMMTNEQINELEDVRSVGLQLKHVRAQKLRYFGHIMRQPWDNIEGSLMTGLVEGKRGRGRPRVSWIDNILQSDDGITWHDMINQTTHGTSACHFALIYPLGNANVSQVVKDIVMDFMQLFFAPQSTDHSTPSAQCK